MFKGLPILALLVLGMYIVERPWHRHPLGRHRRQAPTRHVPRQDRQVNRW
jgi:hypothetical protein